MEGGKGKDGGRWGERKEMGWERGLLGVCYAAHLESTRRRCRRAWTPKRGGGGLGGEGLDPSPLRPGHAHGFWLPMRAPEIAANNGIAVGKGGERVWLLNGVSTYCTIACC